jgi:hypothetical protein
LTNRQQCEEDRQRSRAVTAKEVMPSHKTPDAP